jgi:hypothetical protein
MFPGMIDSEPLPEPGEGSLPQVELLETDQLRRLWRLSGPCEARIEWTLDHRGLAALLGRERLTVDGQTAWWDLALSHGFVMDVPFHLYCPTGRLNALLQRWIVRGEVVALRLQVEGVIVYRGGDVETWLPNARPALPLPAAAVSGNPLELPLPAARTGQTGPGATVFRTESPPEACTPQEEQE